MLGHVHIRSLRPLSFYAILHDQIQTLSVTSVIDVAKIFRDGCIRPRGARHTGVPGGFQRGPLALDLGFQLTPWAPAGHCVVIGAPDTSKELSWLQEASYVYQENSYGDYT